MIQNTVFLQIVSAKNILFMNKKIAIMWKLYENFYIFYLQKRIVSGKIQLYIEKREKSVSRYSSYKKCTKKFI